MKSKLDEGFRPLKRTLFGDGLALVITKLAVLRDGLGFGFGFVARVLRIRAQKLREGRDEILVVQACRRVPNLNQAAPRELDELLEVLVFVHALDRGDDLFLQDVLASVH